VARSEQPFAGCPTNGCSESVVFSALKLAGSLLLSMRSEWKAWSALNVDLYLTNPREVLHGVKVHRQGF
jgi:hypothetical protein